MTLGARLGFDSRTAGTIPIIVELANMLKPGWLFRRAPAVQDHLKRIAYFTALLAEFRNAGDVMSAEGQLLYLLRLSRRYSRKNSSNASLAWHQQARLHASLAGYLARRFPDKKEHISGAFAQADALFEMLEQSLYPWIPSQYRSSLEWKQQLSGQGLVTCIPSKYITLGMTSLRGLRIIFGANLPIHVYYAGEDDLDPKSRELLEKIENVHTFSLAKIFSPSLKGFQVKPFAILASGFAEVIWFDADLVFSTNPTNLFQDVGYKETGTLYFHDRPVLGWGNEEGASIDWSWVQGVIGRGSDFLRASHAFKGESSNIVDSSAVVMHVSRNFPAMLAIAKMNLDAETYGHVWGDKETFWLGFELLRQPWSMNRWGMSGVTFLPSNESTCAGADTWEDSQGVDLPACGHLGPNNTVQMIHFSESKIRGPPPFTASPVGHIQALNKLWHTTCVQIDGTRLDRFSHHQLDVFQTYIHTYMESLRL
ncbi:hypothetical protein MMC16_007771 [Acarospora aff. strigata]|nr:hypothetical protein [Acarospora aff. strigata]